MRHATHTSLYLGAYPYLNTGAMSLRRRPPSLVALLMCLLTTQTLAGCRVNGDQDASSRTISRAFLRTHCPSFVSLQGGARKDFLDRPEATYRFQGGLGGDALICHQGEGRWRSFSRRDSNDSGQHFPKDKAPRGSNYPPRRGGRTSDGASNHRKGSSDENGKDSPGPNDTRGQGLRKALSTLTGLRGRHLASPTSRVAHPKNPPGPSTPPPPKAAKKTPVSHSPHGPTTRLNKILAHAGVASRRGAEALIAAGKVEVNGVVVRDLACQVDPVMDTVVVEGQKLSLVARKPYEVVWMKAHKPKGTLSSVHDAKGRKCLGDLGEEVGAKRLLPVGKLNRETAGLILLTNDHEGIHLLSHPSSGYVKVFKAVVEKGMPSAHALHLLAKGLVLAEGGEEGGGQGGAEERRKGGKEYDRRGRARPLGGEGRGERVLEPLGVEIRDYFADKKEAVLEVTVRTTKSEELRQALRQVGHPVKSLTRTEYGPIVLRDVRAGEVKRLSIAEKSRLEASLAAVRKRTARRKRKALGPGEGRGKERGQGRRKSGQGGREREEGREGVDAEIEAFWDAVEEEEDKEEDGVWWGKEEE